MSVQSDIESIEARLKIAGVSVRAFCVAAGVNQSTWTRWKAGETTPNMSTWERVHDALDKLDPDKADLGETSDAA